MDIDAAQATRSRGVMHEHLEFISVVSVETVLRAEPHESLVVLYDFGRLGLGQSLTCRESRESDIVGIDRGNSHRGRRLREQDSEEQCQHRDQHVIEMAGRIPLCPSSAPRWLLEANPFEGYRSPRARPTLIHNSQEDSRLCSAYSPCSPTDGQVSLYSSSGWPLVSC